MEAFNKAENHVCELQHRSKHRPLTQSRRTLGKNQVAEIKGLERFECSCGRCLERQLFVIKRSNVGNTRQAATDKHPNQNSADSAFSGVQLEGLRAMWTCETRHGRGALFFRWAPWGYFGLRACSEVHVARKLATC